MSFLEEWSEEKLRNNYKYHGCRYFPDLTPSPELSYLLGVRYGDMWFTPYQSILEVKDRDFIEEFARCAEVVMGRGYEIRSVREDKFRVYVSSLILRDFFNDLSLDTHGAWVECYPSTFLVGFFDSEGCPRKYIPKKYSPRRYGQFEVSGSSVNKEVLLYIGRLLKEYFDISFSVTTPFSGTKNIGKVVGHLKNGYPVIQRNAQHRFYMGGFDNIKKFYDEIGFSIVRKNEVLKKNLDLASRRHSESWETTEVRDRDLKMTNKEEEKK